MAPAVQQASLDEPVKLERVDVGDGNLIKMSPADKKAWEERQVVEQATRVAYTQLLAGETPADESLTAAVVPLIILTRAELVALAEARGLATSGNKEKIAARFAGAEDDDDEADDDDDGQEGGTEG